MTTILAFDTSGPWCVADVLQGDDIIGSAAEPMAKGQAEALMPMLQALMTDLGLTMRDLTAIGTGVGPGNFTGVRIAVSAARGLALGLGIPAIGVSRFQAEAGPRAAGPLAISLRAPRDHAYLQLLDGLTAMGPAHVLDLGGGDAPDLPPGTPVAGFAAGRIGAGRVTEYDPDVMFDDLGARIARVSARMLRHGTDHPRPAPLYIRAADAAPPRDPAPTLLP